MRDRRRRRRRRPGRHGRHGRDGGTGKTQLAVAVAPHAVEPAGRGPAGLGDTSGRDAIHDRVRAGAARRGRAGPGEGSPGRRLALAARGWPGPVCRGWWCSTISTTPRYSRGSGLGRQQAGRGHHQAGRTPRSRRPARASWRSARSAAASLSYLSTKLQRRPGPVDRVRSIWPSTSGSCRLPWPQAGALMAGCRDRLPPVPHLDRRAEAAPPGTRAGAKSTVAATGALALELANQRQPRRPRLADARADLHAGPQWHPRRGAHQPGFLRVPDAGPGATPVDEAQARTAVHTPGAAGPGRHRHQRCRPHGAGSRAGQEAVREASPRRCDQAARAAADVVSEPGRCGRCRPRSIRPSAAAAKLRQVARVLLWTPGAPVLMR